MNCPPVSTLTPTPEVGRRIFDDAWDTWRATVDGTLDYWTAAIRRGDTPVDVMQDGIAWVTEMNTRRTPLWASPNEVILESPIMRLRDFSQGSADDVVPTVVFPPQAGHDSCIIDYSGEQSQMDTIRAAGLTKVYALEWVGATAETKDSSIEDYLDIAERAIEAIGGGPVNLVGDCQGGWLATIYAALHPEQVHTLTIAGAPIDFHGEAVIHDWVNYLSPLDMSFYEEVVRLGGGVLKGEYMLNGFITIKPDNEVAKQLQLLGHIREPEHVQRYRAFEDWFKHTQDIPGAFYLWIVQHLFRDNELIRGELTIGGETVDLAQIDVPLFLLGGGTDHITPPAQVFALEDYASTPAQDVVKRVTSGGHLGLFMGSEALREHWPPILAAVYEHSTPGGSAALAARRAKAATSRPPRAIPAP